MAASPTPGSRPPPLDPVEIDPENVPRYVLVAYDPWGDERGEIIDHAGYNMIRAWLDSGSLTVNHALIEGLDDDAVDSIEKHGWLKDARMRVYRIGEDDERVPIRNGTFVTGTEDDDRKNKAQPGVFQFVDLGSFIFSNARIADPTNTDEAEGPSKPTYTWTAASNMTPGRMLQNRLTSAQDRDGTLDDPSDTQTWAPGLRWGFTLTNDSNGVPWAWNLLDDFGGDFELPASDNLDTLLAWLTDSQGAIDWWIEPHDDDDKEWLVIVNAGTGSVDRSVRDTTDYVEMVDSAVLAAQETKDNTGRATHAWTESDDGLYKWVWNPDAVSPFGRLEIAVAATGAKHPDALDRAARGPLRAAQRAAESIRRDIAAVIPGVAWPDRDFELGDNLAVQREHDLAQADDDELMRSLQAVGCSVEITADRVTKGYVIFNSRQEQAVDRIARRQHRQTSGTTAGYGGQPRVPDQDPRVPLAPTTPAASVTYDLVGGETRATFTTTADAVTQATSLYDAAVFEDIDLWGYIHYRKRSGSFKIREFARTPVSEGTSIVFGNEAHWDARTNWKYYRSALSHSNVEGPMSAEVAVTVTSDTEPVQGPSQIRDGGFQSAVINDKRATDAGAGFSFAAVSGVNWADFTTTTPELNLAVAELNGRGRVQVIAGEWYRLKVSAYRQGLSAASVRGRLRWLDAAGSQIGSVVNVFTSTVTTSAADYADIAQAPALAKRVEVRVTGTSFTGSGSLRVADVDITRRIIEPHVNDDAVIARTIIATDPLTTKHTITGMLAQSHSGSTTGAKFTTSGIFYYVSGAAVFSASASGIYVKGTVETGSGMIIGGAGLADIQFASGYTIGTAGGFLEFNAGGSGFKFNGALLASNGITGSSTLQITSTVTFLGSAKLCGLGSVLGFFGATGGTRLAVDTRALSSAADRDAVINSLRATLQQYNLG